MEVTHKNQSKVWPEYKKAIEEADFIAIDTEFTGLDRSATENYYDTPEERYEKLRAGCDRFPIVQYGICTFAWNDKIQRYISKPFNFYVFKRPFGREQEGIKFECQNSCMVFLGKEGFDFNKWVNQGLSYMYPQEEDRVKSRRSNGRGRHSFPVASQSVEKKLPASPLKTSDKKYVEEVCKRAANLLKSCDETSLMLSPTSGAKRRLIYEAVEKRFANQIVTETCRDDSTIAVLRLSKADTIDLTSSQGSQEFSNPTEQKPKETAEEPVDPLDLVFGFNKFIKLLSDSGKLIIGHNMLLDVMMSINQFFAPLPLLLDDFKQIVHAVFPRLMDTKVLASSALIKDKMSNTSLNDVRLRVMESPFQVPATTFADGFMTYSSGEERFHEAAYDAYLTGYSFIGMATFLCSMQKETILVDLDADIVKPFMSRINLMRMEGLTYMTIDRQDELPDRSHIFHIEFPPSWCNSHISEVFSPYGYVYIKRLSETSAYAALAKQENANRVIRELVSTEGSAVARITTYDQFKRPHASSSDDCSEEPLASTHSRKRPLPASDEVRSKKKKVQLAAEDLEDGELPSDDESNDGSEAEVPQERGSQADAASLFEVPSSW